jgi:hypothetical protein
MRREKENGFSKRPRKRFRIRKVLILGLTAFLLAGFFGIPMLVQNRGLAVSMINRYAGLEPMRVDLAEIQAGWFRPIRIRGFQLSDEQGAELARVEEIETELSLLNLISSYTDLKTITVQGASVRLDVQPGTTNLEKALKPFLEPAASPTDSSDGAASGTSSFSGRIRIADAVIHARDSVDLTSWDLAIKQADIPLPTVEQPIPPMTLIGTIQQTNAPPGVVLMGGQFSVQTQPLAQPIVAVGATANGLMPLKMSIATNGLPLHWFSLVKRRLPEIPIESIAGLATVQADIELHNQQQVLAQIHTAQIDSLQVHAPMLVGPRGAALQQIRLAGTVNKGQDRIKTDGLQLASDVGTLKAILDLPLVPNVPTLTQPWIMNADYEVNGSIDLARVIQVAPDLLPMQDQVELVRGEAILIASQKRSVVDATVPPDSNMQIKLGGLEAIMNGTSMRWDEALNATLDVRPIAGGQPSFKADCKAEFCNIQGQGDLVQGQLAGSFDLAKMQQRLSKWFALPVQSLAGAAECQVAWKQDESNRLIANGALKTTPVRMVTQFGQLNEPAWEGDLQLVARLDKGSLIQIDRSSVQLKANTELLSASIQEPVSLVPSTPGMAQLPPAGMQWKMTGDLAGWQRRAKMFAGIDLGLDLGGQCELEAKGVVDASHAEISLAKFSATKFFVQSGETRFAEPQVVGQFQGRISTKDISRLQVDNLLVQSLSFALQAKDEAGAQAGTRIGQAGFRINPNQLLIAMQSGEATTTSVDGDVTGQLKWQLDPSQIVWALGVDALNIKAIQKAIDTTTKLVSTGASVPPATTILWEEPQAKAIASGRYDLNTGKLDVSDSQLQTEWFAYGGNAVLTSSKEKMEFLSKGNVTYDAARVAEKLKPWTGSYLVVAGQRTQPLEVSWTSSGSNATWSDALQATSNIGWDSASVIGIPIGKADVPLKIENGHLLTKAEIPVSQGTLRWNLDGDLASNPIAIVQAPETVIDNVAISPQMCQGWLKYVAPLLAEVTSVQGNLSLKIDEAVIMPTDLPKQTVKGQLTIHGANVGPGPLADQLLALVQQVRNLRKGLGAQDGGGAATTWLHMPTQTVGFNVQQGRVSHQNMQIQAGDVVVQTSGTVGIDGSLDLVASVPIQKDWIDKTPALQSLAGQSLQLPLRGTVQRPQVDYTAFTSIAQQIGGAALRSEAQKQMEKGMNKLLGPLSNQLAPLQQGMQQMQQGVQQNLPQIPLPNLQNLQIPGFGGTNPFGGSAPAPAVPPQPQ